MARLIARRILISIPLLLVVSLVTYILELLVPGDVVWSILGSTGTRAEYEALRQQLGLNQPWYEQYWHWLAGALRGDLGHSIRTGESVVSMLGQRVPVTLSVLLLTAIVCAVVGTSLGLLGALRRGPLGRSVDALSVVGLALPPFWVALVLVEVFSVRLGLLPSTGFVSFAVSPLDWLSSLILPVAALALASVTIVAKQTRDAMLDALGRDYVLSLRACGIGDRSIVLRHVLRNAGLPIVTQLGNVVVAALSGAVFIEAVFSLPGLGSLAVSTIQQHDLPVIQGIAVYFTLFTIAVNLMVDLLYGWLNPKVRAT